MKNLPPVRAGEFQRNRNQDDQRRQQEDCFSKTELLHKIGAATPEFSEPPPEFARAGGVASRNFSGVGKARI
jgi:hypothetical protein